jgi:hypothetical protein
MAEDRDARAERLGPYFEIQLRLAGRMAELTGMGLGAAAFHYTNLHRRFGLGFSGITEPARPWLDYAARLDAARDLAQQVAVSQAMFRSSADEVWPRPDQEGFGCFALDAHGEDGVVHIHFYNKDTDDAGGPLAAAKVERRRAELAAMVRRIREVRPDATHIRGKSWLYNLEAYRRLFPPDYAASRTIAPGPLHLTGNSTWGQFIDSRETIRTGIRDALVANLADLDPHAPWTVFPFRVLAVRAPIESFVAFYDL